MKDLRLLVWLTQLGVSVAIPPASFILLTLWLRSQFGLGSWVVIVGIVLGVVGAINGLYTSLKALSRLNRNQPNDAPPTVSFNEHD